MRLRQIKLAGFKSFADPARLELNRPLVGIVGPNGCGKSNVIDAVRWVLGEIRAAELRGGSMKELIFAGSTSRKPMGRASVELSLTNEDGRIKGPWGEFAELNVKRVVTAEGQSSYYINQQHVRRRDIQDLFLGTGLGPRSYAIISQGMISNFIKARPEELRIYLEEAAGVSLYRERRKETESLLSQTRVNLERVHDMQIVKQEEAARLETEAETARRWKTLTDEKNEAEALWYWVQYEDVRQKVDSLNAEIVADEAAMEELKTRILDKEEETPALEATLNTKIQKAAEASLILRAAERALTEAEAERRRHEERRDKARTDLKDAEKIRADKAAEQSLSRKEMAENLESQKAIELEIEEVDAEIAALEEECDRLEEDNETVKREADRSLALAAEEDARMRVAKTESDNARKIAVDCLRRLARLDETKNDLLLPDETEIRIVSERIAELLAESEELRVSAAESDEALVEARLFREKADEVYFGLLSKEKEASAKLDALEDIERQSEMSGKLGEFEKAEGLNGLAMLTDDLTIDPTWVTAVESVLGTNVRAKVLRNLAFAAGYEKKRPPVPLVFADGQAEERANQDNPAWTAENLTALATKVRSNNAAYMRILKEWFAGIWCVPDLETALRLRSQLKVGEALLTPAGDRVTAVSVHIWAAENPGVSVLSRRQAIESLRDTLYLLEEESGAAEKRRYSAKAQVDRQEEEARDIARRLKTLEAELLKAESEEKSLKDRRTLALKHLEDLRRNREEIEEECDASEMEAEEALDRADAAEAKAREAKLAASRIQSTARRRAEELKQKTDRLNRRRRDWDQLRAKQQQLEQARDFLQKRILALNLDLEREDERLAAAEAVLAESIDEPIDERERAAVDALDAAEKAEKEANVGKLMAEEKLAAARKLVRDWQSNLVPMTESLGVKKVERQVKESLREQFSERLDELKADRLTLAKRVLERPLKAQSVRSRVQQLVSQIAALGPVNHAALEHLDSVKKILEETARQVDDLQKGIETLEAAIRKIDSETRGRMRETFEEVNRNFADTFRDLFGGGDAALSWEGEDILTAGIGVHAQPPGKKNSSVKQLSGGEQALTATALVFAMFKLNPAPFCLLDEVDAPLDEANQARLAGMCRRMSVNTQFLMITHHRVTMEYAGSLVGVTMKEPGVSRIVSVDIENAVKMSA